MDAIGKRQQVPYRLKCKYRLRSVGFSKEKILYVVTWGYRVFLFPLIKKGLYRNYTTKRK